MYAGHYARSRKEGGVPALVVHLPSCGGGGAGDTARNKHGLESWAGTSLAVQWLRLRASSARCVGSIPVQGAKIPSAAGHGQKKS